MQSGVNPDAQTLVTHPRVNMHTTLSEQQGGPQGGFFFHQGLTLKDRLGSKQGKNGGESLNFSTITGRLGK